METAVVWGPCLTFSVWVFSIILCFWFLNRMYYKYESVRTMDSFHRLCLVIMIFSAAPILAVPLGVIAFWSEKRRQR